MKRLIKLLIAGVCFIAIVFLVGCKDKANGDAISKDSTEDSDSSFVNSDGKFDFWLAYWEVSDFEEEIEYWKDKISNIVYFAAYFDENNKLFVPKNISESKEVIDELYEGAGFGSYISFVNDKVNSNGKSSLKDTKLLYELFKSDESIDAHIKEIISIALEGGYKGIEIDYEKIRDDIDLWGKFSIFLEGLIKAADKYNLDIRVLLEPLTPVDKIALPEGPEYVMMCYNLYGYGTEPGPKANKEFLLELINKMKEVSSNRGYALATGGFDFAEGGEVKALTKQEAESLKAEYDKVTEARDEESQYNTFTYVDNNKVKHEVWYADNVTLKYLESILRENGEDNISIWKLGENAP